jgi:hypothetical protein
MKNNNGDSSGKGNYVQTNRKNKNKQGRALWMKISNRSGKKLTGNNKGTGKKLQTLQR